MTNLDRKREQRSRFLRRLYEVTEGNRFAACNVEELGKELGLSPEESDNLVQCLEGPGWIEWRSIGLVSITQYGIEEAEQTLEAEKLQVGSRISSQLIGEVAGRLRPGLHTRRTRHPL